MAMISSNTDIKGISYAITGMISRNSDIMDKFIGYVHDIIGNTLENSARKAFYNCFCDIMVISYMISQHGL